MTTFDYHELMDHHDNDRDETSPPVLTPRAIKSRLVGMVLLTFLFVMVCIMRDTPQEEDMVLSMNKTLAHRNITKATPEFQKPPPLTGVSEDREEEDYSTRGYHHYESYVRRGESESSNDPAVSRDATDDSLHSGDSSEDSLVIATRAPFSPFDDDMDLSSPDDDFVAPFVIDKKFEEAIERDIKNATKLSFEHSSLDSD